MHRRATQQQTRGQGSYSLSFKSYIPTSSGRSEVVSAERSAWQVGRINQRDVRPWVGDSVAGHKTTMRHTRAESRSDVTKPGMYHAKRQLFEIAVQIPVVICITFAPFTQWAFRSQNLPCPRQGLETRKSTSLILRAY